MDGSNQTQAQPQVQELPTDKVDPSRGGPYSKPRGGKYVSRKWNHDEQKWEYEYRSDAGHARVHGNVPLADPGDDYHTSSFEVEEGEDIHAPHELYNKKKASWMTTPGSHELNYPTLGKVTLTIEDKPVRTQTRKFTHQYTAKDEKGNILVQSPEIAVVEQTLLRLDQTEYMYDQAGNHIASIVPNIGFVSTEDVARRATIGNENIRRDTKPKKGDIADLIPMERPHLPIPKWAKPGEQNRGIYYTVYDTHGNKIGLHKNIETSRRFVAKKYNVPYEEPSQEKLDQYKELDFVLREDLWDKYTTDDPNEVRRMHSGGEKKRSTKYVRRLNVSPEERDQLVHQAIKENFPAIWMSARTLAKNPTIVTLFSPDDGSSPDTDFIATQLLTGGKSSSFVPTKYEQQLAVKSGQDIPVKVEPDTPLYRAVSDSIDQYGLDGRSLQNLIIGRIGGTKSGSVTFHGKLSHRIRKVVSEKEKEHGYVRRYVDKKGGDDEGDEGAREEKAKFQSGAYESNPEDKYNAYIDNKEDDDEYGEFEEEADDTPKFKMSAEPEDLSGVDIPHDAPEVQEWLNDQVRALNMLAGDYDTRDEKAVIAEQFYQAITRLRKNPQKVPELVKRFQELMRNSGIDDYYVHVTPYLDRIVKKALIFLNLDLNKAITRQLPDIKLKAEPTKESNPEFFTPAGKKLSRAVPTDREVNWNPAYDGKNKNKMWMAKWFDNETGEDTFSYLLEDLEEDPKYKSFNQLATVAAQIEDLRKLYSGLLESESEKDKTTGLVLALLDQGYFDLETLLGLTKEDVKIHSSIIALGKRSIYPTNGIYNAVLDLLNSAEDGQPFFSINNYPVGPSYINSILDAFGLPYSDLKYYQINKLFLFRIVKGAEEGLSLDDSVIQAAKNVSVVMNYGRIKNVDEIIAFITSLINEIVLAHIDEVAMDEESDNIESIGQELSNRHFIPLVDGALKEETEDEKELHKFFYDTQLHRY